MRMICSIAALLLLVLPSLAQSGTPASNAFTFQGELKYNGMPANVMLEATFRLYTTPEADEFPVSPEITRSFRPDNRGRFSVTLDFGESFNGYPVFNGDERYMRIVLLDPPGGLQKDIPLSPLIPLAATPMAAYALNARIPTLAEITDDHLVSTDDLGSLSLNLDDENLGLTIRPNNGQGAIYSYTGIQAAESYAISAADGDVSLVSGMGNLDLVSMQGDIHLDAGLGNISLLSADAFSVMTDTSNITLDPGGYALNALNVDLDSTLSTNITAGATMSLSAAATLTLSAAVTTINGNQFDGVNVIINQNLLATQNAFKPGGGPWSVLSDVRQKKNIAPLHGSLDTLLSLRPVHYEYTDADNPLYVQGVQTGFVAQEVQRIIPEWVDSAPDGTLMLTPRGFEAMVVDAMQELQQQHDDQINTLRQENQELRAHLERLELLIQAGIP